MSCDGLFFLIKANVPVTFFIGTPGWKQIEPLHVGENYGQILNTVGAECLQELEWVSAIHTALALGSVLVSVRDLKQAVVDQVLG